MKFWVLLPLLAAVAVASPVYPYTPFGTYLLSYPDPAEYGPEPRNNIPGVVGSATAATQSIAAWQLKQLRRKWVFIVCLLDTACPTIAFPDKHPWAPTSARAPVRSYPVQFRIDDFDEEMQHRQILTPNRLVANEMLTPNRLAANEMLTPNRLAANEMLTPNRLAANEMLTPNRVVANELFTPNRVVANELLTPNRLIPDDGQNAVITNSVPSVTNIRGGNKSTSKLVGLAEFQMAQWIWRWNIILCFVNPSCPHVNIPSTTSRFGRQYPPIRVDVEKMRMMAETQEQPRVMFPVSFVQD